MKVEYEKILPVTYSDLGTNLEMDVVSSFNFVQNVMTEYFESFGSDNIVLKNNDKAIWVVTKSKIHIEKYPIWRDNIKGKCYTTKVKPIRSESQIIFKNENNDICFLAKQEYCVIDLETRKIKKISEITYPKDMEVEEEIFDKPYLKLNDEFQEDNYVYEQIVRASDIDYSKHTNNAIYIRYVLNSLPSDFFDKYAITDVEIHYINESKEGQKLKIYKKQNNNSIDFLIKEDNREIIRANIEFKEKIIKGK